MTSCSDSVIRSGWKTSHHTSFVSFMTTSHRDTWRGLTVYTYRRDSKYTEMGGNLRDVTHIWRIDLVHLAVCKGVLRTFNRCTIIEFEFIARTQSNTDSPSDGTPMVSHLTPIINQRRSNPIRNYFFTSISAVAFVCYKIILIFHFSSTFPITSKSSFVPVWVPWHTSITKGTSARLDSLQYQSMA